MGITERLPELGSTLRQILKEVLRCRSRSTAVKGSAETSESSRRACPVPPCLPQLSQVSLFPNFESDRFRIDRYSVPTADGFASRHSHLESPSIESRLSLLPATRLNQFDLNQLFSNHQALPQHRVRYEPLPVAFAEGASLRASMLTPDHQPSLRLASTTLNIRRSTRSNSSESWSALATSASSPSKSGLKKARASENLRRNPPAIMFASRSADEIDSEVFNSPTPTPSSNQTSRSNASIHSVKYFGSFCVLDTFVPGCPVTATSEDLRYIYHIGDQFVLNVHDYDEMSIDIVTGTGPDGEEVIHLVLFSPLLSPGTGTSRFILAALIDVTHFLREASQIPEQDTIGQESSFEDEAISQAPTSLQSDWSTRSCELLSDNLLGGCSITARRQHNPVTEVASSSRLHKSNPRDIEHDSEDIWLALAREERLEKDWQPCVAPVNGGPMGSKTNQSRPSESMQASSSSTVVDEVLEEFMSTLQQLYSESFLLARSPLDDKYYEICNVSPAVYDSGDYVIGHLTHTAPHVVESISGGLAAGIAFRTEVRWGSQGTEKGLYCVPLYGESSTTWICVLVDQHMPVLW